MDIPSIALPPEIPDHELIRRIGSGSYGEVWLARTQMGTFRAVKVVHGHRFGDDERPFERELEGLAKYEPISRSHAGLVAILHFGRNEAGGYFYYVMDLADDRVDANVIDPATYVPRTLALESKLQGRMPISECVELGIALAEALHELHRHSLVHRDVKPSNIIFVNRTPKLADIGLIADVAEARSYVGTEGFIAPEGPGSPQGDIYSLGKLLYEVSTGKDRTDFPTLPPDLADNKDFLEFNEVLVKACDADTVRRYKSAREVVSDLALLRSGDSVRRLRRLERVFSILKKAAMIVGVLLPLLLVFYFQADYRKKKAAEIRQLHLGGYLADGAYALNSGDYAGSLSPFLSAAMLESFDPKRARTHRLRLRQVLERCPKLVQMFFHDQLQVEQVEFSRSEELVLSVTWWGKAHVWNARTGELLVKPFATGNNLMGASFSPDSKYVITADQHGEAAVWLTATGQLVTNMMHASKMLDSARFSPDGQEILLAGGDGTLEIRSFPSTVLKMNLVGHTNSLTYASYRSDRRYLLTTARDGRAIVWDGHNYQKLFDLPHESWVYQGDFSHDGRFLVTACFDRKVRIWDLRTGELLHPEMPHGDGVYAARFSPDDRYIVTACLDGLARIWDVRTRQLLPENGMLRHGDRVHDACFSRDGRRIVLGCGDGTARIWDLAGGAAKPEPAREFYAADGSLVDVAKLETAVPDLSIRGLSLPQSNHAYPKFGITRSGQFLFRLDAVETNLFRFQIWDGPKLRLISPPIEIAWPEENPSAVISDNGRYGLLYSRNLAQVYDLRSDKPPHNRLELKFHVAGAGFSPDSKWVNIFGGYTAIIQHVGTGTPACQIPLYQGQVRFTDFSEDSREFLVCTTSGTFEKLFAEIWFPETGRKFGKRLEHTDGVLTAAFSDDGRAVVTGSEDFHAKIWNTATGQQLLPSLVHETKVLCAAFSHSGEWVATGTSHGKVRIWDAATRKPLTPPLTIPHEMPFRIRFSKDDTVLFVTTEEGGAWQWRLGVENRSLQDLASLYELVCGRGDFEVNRFRTTPQARLKEAWNKFRSKNPEQFQTSEAELAAWNQ